MHFGIYTFARPTIECTLSDIGKGLHPSLSYSPPNTRVVILASHFFPVLYEQESCLATMHIGGIYSYPAAEYRFDHADIFWAVTGIPLHQPNARRGDDKSIAPFSICNGIAT